MSSSVHRFSAFLAIGCSVERLGRNHVLAVEDTVQSDVLAVPQVRQQLKTNVSNKRLSIFEF